MSTDLSAPTRATWSTRTRLLGLGAVMVVALGAHTWGLTRDLPMPDVDERYFVSPAAYVAASGDADPHWFGHPGSTVIYPLALAFRVREVVFHGAPLTGAAPSIATRLQSDPGSFYLIGRLWAMLFSLAALPLLFAIGRRVFGDLVALLATAMWAVVPLAVQYGQITRTDSVALFFTLATIWCCLHALERRSTRWLTAAGVTAGLGVASRYFLAVLVVVIGATWLAMRRETVPSEPGVKEAPRKPTPVSMLAFPLMAMVATFMLTTPFFFLDWHRAIESLTTEATARIPSQPNGPIDNLRFYVTSAIPQTLSWIGCVAFAIGVGRAFRRRTAERMLLLLWVPCILLTICVLPAHWSRWLIPALPIIVLFAVYGAVGVGRVIAAHSAVDSGRRRVVFGTVIVVALVVMAIGPATALVDLDRSEAEPSTRVEAEIWMRKHLPVGSRVAVEVKGPDLTGSGFRFVNHYALPLAGTVADYARSGYRYLLVNTEVVHRYRLHPRDHRTQVAFYDFLRDDAAFLKGFRRDRAHGGPHLKLYDLGPTRRIVDHDGDADGRADAITLIPSAGSYVGRGSIPVPFDGRALRHLAHEAA